MACFTKTQQCNGTNCGFEKKVTTSKFFVLNSLDKSHLNSVRTQYVCDKSENTRVCVKWQWNALDWCYWIALPSSPVMQSSNTVSCVSLSFRTHPCVLAIAYNDLWPWPISSRSFGLGLESRVRSVASTVPDGFFPYVVQMITSMRRCVACDDLWPWPISSRSFDLVLTWDPTWLNSVGNHEAARGILRTQAF